jgi:CubicO group peptidase (beta-lactamase class C family)
MIIKSIYSISMPSFLRRTVFSLGLLLCHSPWILAFDHPGGPISESKATSNADSTGNTLAYVLDSLMQLGIDSMAFPGGQLVVAHKGKVIHERAYGYHTYLKNREVGLDHLYDLASITKVASGAPALMYLVDQGLISLDDNLCDLFKDLCGSNKGNLNLREVLAHQARLQPYIVFWQEAQRKNGRYRTRSFKSVSSDKYPIRISENLYLHHRYQKKMFRKVQKSTLNENPGYLYSGLTFLLYPQLVKEKTGLDIDRFMTKYFFEKLKAPRICYRPLDQYPLEEIVPTEIDTVFRFKPVRGTVHDEAAAMLDGLSCNAGLFASAPDLLRLCHLYLKGGIVDGERILSQEVINEFTRCQFCEEGNRRGLAFDKPPIEYEEGASYVAKSASPASYGHSGFTGTFFWIDPEEELVFILLTNRVYPTRDQRKLYSMGLRPTLHQAVYDWIDDLKRKG